MCPNSLVKQKSAILKSIFIGILLFSSILSAHEFIAITEILKNPLGSSNAIPGDASHECVEITNLGSDTFFIDSLFLFDNPGGIDSIAPWDTLKYGVLTPHRDCIFNNHAIAPGSSALILDQDYFTALQVQPSSHFSIDASTTILTVTRKDLGSGGLSNTDGIAIFKGARSKISRIVAYVSDQCADFSLTDTLHQTKPLPPEGVSIVPTSLLFCPPVFISCPTGLSLGHYEFVHNNWLVECKLAKPLSRASIACSLACCKVGASHTIASWSMERKILSTISILKQGTFSVDSPLTRIVVSLPLDSAAYAFMISENGVSTKWTVDVSTVWTPPNPLKINELFPRAQSDDPEWFELINSSSMPINLNNWRYGNAESSFPITQQDIVVAPGRFLVITKDKALFSARFPAIPNVCQPDAWLAMDNYKDTLSLWNNQGALTETAAYDYTWFDNWTDQSLERVSLQIPGTDRNAWVVAVKPTPGQPNASVSTRSSADPSLDIGPIPFTPNGDGKNDFLSIRCTVPAVYSVTIAIYGFNGNKYCDVPVNLQTEILWDGKTSNGRAAPIGPYFVVATFKNGSQTKAIRKKGILWR
jgi:hypothetical protein